jgi:hypothetical protein
MDGFSRSFAEAVATIFGGIGSGSWKKLYWSFLLFTSAFAILLVSTIGNPVTLVLAAALLSLSVAPLYYWLNYYCVTRFIEDKSLKPKLPARIIAIIGVILMLAASALYIASKLNLVK